MTVPKVRLPRLSLRGKWNKLSAAMQFLILIFLIGTVGVGVAYATSVTLSDGEWVGLGASAGRLEVDDLATDQLLIKDAYFLVESGIIGSGVLDTTAGSFAGYGSASGTEGGQLTLWLGADHDTTAEYIAIDAYEDDLRFFSSDSVINNKFTSDAGAVFNETGNSTQDLRAEGDTDANLLFVDASADRVGISTNSPGATLDVDGSATFNESGADVDFRIEGDTEANLLVVDGGLDEISIFGDLSIDGNLNFELAPATPVSGVITATAPSMIVGSEHEGGSHEDDVDTINGCNQGSVLFLQTFVLDTVTYKDGTGNLELDGDFVSGVDDTLVLVCFNGENQWLEVSRSDNS